MSNSQNTTDEGITVTNFERATLPRELTQSEVEEGYEQPGDDTTRPFYAIFRADGWIGFDIGRHTRNPKIELLYATEDGERVVTDFVRARETEGIRHDFQGTYPVVRQLEPRAGDTVPEESRHYYRDVAHDRYDITSGDGDE